MNYHRMTSSGDIRTFGWIALLTAWIPFTVTGATYANPRALNLGDIYELRRDGWTDPVGGQSYVGDVLPKSDANDGLSGDNRYFRRHNVSRAWPTGTGYWFTESDQFEGEPDPAGEQWVDYVPAFEVLGSGRYAIEASYRWSSTRASYPAIYRVHHALGTNEVLQDQRMGSASTTIFWITLGEFELRPGSFVRVEDTGNGSITFANMRFRLVAPAPRLQVTLVQGTSILRWPTNAVGYRLEYTNDLTAPAGWVPVPDQPIVDGEFFGSAVPPEGVGRFYRLVSP